MCAGFSEHGIRPWSPPMCSASRLSAPVSAGESVLGAHVARDVNMGTRYSSDDDFFAAGEICQASRIARGVTKGPPQRIGIRVALVHGASVTRV